MSFEKNPEIDAQHSLKMYEDFLIFELLEAVGASAFQILHPAPDNIPIGRLEELAASFRETGWNAQLMPLEVDDLGYFGIKITD
jgi:hypothetical protein